MSREMVALRQPLQKEAVRLAEEVAELSPYVTVLFNNAGYAAKCRFTGYADALEQDIS